MNGFEISRTARPSVAVVNGNGQFFTTSTRTGSAVSDWMLTVICDAAAEVSAIDEEIQQDDQNFGPRHYLKLRNAYFDDKTANLTLHVDYLYDRSTSPLYDEDSFKNRLKDGNVDGHGQGRWVEITLREAMFSSDGFSPISDEHYT